MKVGRYIVEVSNEDKIFFPRSKITKGDLLDYYQRIAPIMLQHCKGRLLTMERFPDGIRKEGFYHKNAPDYYPSWIKRVPVKTQEGKTVHYVACQNEATLVYIANQGCITPHLWLSKTDKLDKPDKIIFDLDPSGEFVAVMQVAKLLRVALQARDLDPWVMTTGSRGLHVIVPTTRRYSFEETRAFAREVAGELVAAHPKLVTIEARKAKRRGRVYIDVGRNAWGQTAVAPYAVRAIEGAPVATPIQWRELRTGFKPDKFTIKNIFTRLARKGDVWG